MVEEKFEILGELAWNDPYGKFSCIDFVKSFFVLTHSIKLKQVIKGSIIFDQLGLHHV